MSSIDDSDRKRPPPPGDDDGGGKRPASAPSEEEDTCWLCLEATHESGQPLRRECSCRGSSGHVHLPCLVEYATQWSKRREKINYQFGYAWMVCRNCNQGFGHELATNLASEFMIFVEENYPGNTRQHLEALRVKLHSCMHRKSDPEVRENAVRTAKRMLSMIDEMKKDHSSYPQTFIREVEAQVYFSRAFIALEEGLEESPRTAVDFLEKSLEISKGIDDKHLIAAAESGLARAKSRCKGGNALDDESVLESNRKLYETTIAGLGEDNFGSISFGLNFAKSLKRAHHGVEAERLLTKLATSSKRVLGPEHNTTRQISKNLSECKRRWVDVEARCAEDYLAMWYLQDGKKCAVRAMDRYEEDAVFVDSNDIIFTLGTPVMCEGIETPTQEHLNGKIGDIRYLDDATKSYKVYFEDEQLEPCMVKGRNLRIVFDLPSDS